MVIDLVLLQPPDKISANPKMYFPLSLCYLASVVSKAGYSVKILDFRDSIKDLPQARYYGFSCTTPQIETARFLASLVNGTTIIGGAHASLLPEDCERYFDFVVVGEGEQTILDILQDKVRPGIVKSSRILDLDTVPYPAWDMVAEPFSDTLFPGERYGRGALGATLIGSRGCPFSCAYCGNIHRTPVVYRSKENIIGELKELIKRGVNHFRFEDDNFTLHPEFNKLCAALKFISIKYKCHTRSDLLDDEQAYLMAQSGCEECALGVESADDSVLKLNHKKETAKDHARAIAILKRHGIRVKTYFMAGLPGETDRTIELNKQFVIETQPDKWTVSTFTPYPGCDIFKHSEKYGVEIINKAWGNWANFCKSGYNHILVGQTPDEMWVRYLNFYEWLKEEKWRANLKG